MFYYEIGVINLGTFLGWICINISSSATYTTFVTSCDVVNKKNDQFRRILFNHKIQNQMMYFPVVYSSASVLHGKSEWFYKYLYRSFCMKLSNNKFIRNLKKWRIIVKLSPQVVRVKLWFNKYERCIFVFDIDIFFRKYESIVLKIFCLKVPYS